MNKNWEVWVVIAFMIAFMGWCGWRSYEIDNNFALLDHCAARANDGETGTQAVCINDKTEVKSVRCVKGVTQITCEMNGYDYGFDL